MKALLALILWIIAILPLTRSKCSVERRVQPINEQVVVLCPSYLQLFSISQHRKTPGDVESVTIEGKKWYRRETPIVDLRVVDLAKTAVRREADGTWAVSIAIVKHSAARLEEWARLHSGEQYGVFIDQKVHFVGDVPAASSGFLIRGFRDEASATMVAKRIIAGGCAAAEAQCSAMEFESKPRPTSRPGVAGCPGYFQLFSVCEHRIRASDVEIVDRAGRHWFRRASPVVDLSDLDLDETFMGRDDQGKPTVIVSVGDWSLGRVRAWSHAHRDEYGAALIDNRVHRIAEIHNLSQLLVVGTFDDEPSAEAVRDRVVRGGCEAAGAGH